LKINTRNLILEVGMFLSKEQKRYLYFIKLLNCTLRDFP